MRRAVKYILGVAAAFMCLAVALFEWSSYTDEKRFGAAKNECERKCIQDSGGLINVARTVFIIRTATHEAGNTYGVEQ